MPKFVNYEHGLNYYKVCIRNLQMEIGTRAYALKLHGNDPQLKAMFERLSELIKTKTQYSNKVRCML